MKLFVDNMSLPKGKSLIIFDDECIICNSTVNFILKYDVAEKFIFTSFDSSFINTKLNLKIDNASVCVIAGERIFQKSEAVIYVLDNLSFPLKKIFNLFRFLPVKLRNGIYEFVAKNRYRVFTKLDKCDNNFSKYANRFLF